jgi:hypothetical protein
MAGDSPSCRCRSRPLGEGFDNAAALTFSSTADEVDELKPGNAGVEGLIVGLDP